MARALPRGDVWRKPKCNDVGRAGGRMEAGGANYDAVRHCREGSECRANN